jgi:hypothetical protein
MMTVNIHEAKTQLSKLVDRAAQLARYAGPVRKV